MKIGNLWLLSVFILLFSCNESKKISDEKSLNKTPDSEEIEVGANLEGTWFLQKLNKQTIKNKTSYKNPTLKIVPSEEAVTGNSGCNKYTGNIRFVETNKIDIDIVEITKAPCPDSDLEKEYLEAIMGENLTYEIDGNEVILYNDDATLIFEKAD